MKSRYSFLLSLVIAGTLVTAALADPKYVGQKQPAPKQKEGKREQVSKRQQTPPSQRDKFKEWNKDARKDAPPPKKVERQAPPAQRDNPKSVRRAPQGYPQKPQQRGGGEIAPKPGRERMPQRDAQAPERDWPGGVKPQAPKPTGPMPTFLKDRPAETLKQKLPQHKIEGTIESLEDEKAIVRTRDGRRAVVQIGPESYRRQKNIRLERGQEVSVNGWGEWGNGGDRAEGEGFFFAGGIYGPGYHFEFADNDGYPYWADPDDYWDGWYPSWDAYYIYFWGPPPWWAYSPPPWYYRPPYWWQRHYTYYSDPYYYPRHHRHHHRW